MKACCKTNPNYLIVLEYMEAGNLYDLLHDTKVKLDWSQRLNIAYQIALAVQYLHSKGLVHGDLKSLNVLLSSKLQVKLCDFNYTDTEENQSLMKQHGVINIFKF